MIAPSGPIHIPRNRHQVIVIPNSHCQRPPHSQDPELSQKLRRQMPLPRIISSVLGKYHRGYFAQDNVPLPRQRLLCLLINPVTSSSGVHCLVETSGLAIIDLKCLRLPRHPKPPALMAKPSQHAPISSIFFNQSPRYIRSGILFRDQGCYAAHEKQPR